MIPKIIHYVWVGPQPLPDIDRRRVDAWRNLLPDWEIRSWGNDDVDFSSRYLRAAYAVRAWNRVSDYMRVDVLSRFGGVYLDTDVDLIQSLDPLLNHGAFVGFQAGDELPDEMVNGAVFGAKPNHWLPTRLRDYLDDQLDGSTNSGSFSGPGLLTKMLRERGLQSSSEAPLQIDDLTIFPKPVFYPYSWLEQYSEDVITTETFAVHRWAATWQPKATFPLKLRRALLRSFARYAPQLALRVACALVKRGNRPTTKVP